MVKSQRQISLRERLNISRLAIAHPWLTVCFWLAVTVAGLLAFSSLKYALFPDITFPVVVVNAQAPIETALETETKLTVPIEQQLQSLAGLDDTRSSTYSGQTVVSIAFDVGTNLESSTEAVETALQQAELPPESTFETISINLNESAAITYAIKSESKTLPELIQIAKEQILPPIAELPGVLKIKLLGDATPDEEENNSSITASPTLARFNNENAVAFQVIKRGEANTLEVVSRVEEAVQQLQAGLPEVQLVLAETEADYIREATQATIDALLLAIVLAVLVIFPFLRNFRATLITALAIPISLLGTCIAMAVAGFNLETITLLALALVIGIIVDDAIVDVENISRHIEAGETPRQAAIAGTDEIGWTVSASTLTIVAVFLPIAFMGGTVGQFFKPFGLTVSVAVFTSLLVARTLSPVLAVYWLRHGYAETRRHGDTETVETSPIPNSQFPIPNSQFPIPNSQFPIPNSQFPIPNSQGLAHHYHNLLRWSLNHRQIVVGLAVASFIAGIALIPLIPKGFIPKLDRGEFNIVYTSPLPDLSSRFEGLNPSPEQEQEASSNTPADNTGSIFGDLFQSPIKILLYKSRSVAREIEEVVLDSSAVESVFTTVGVRGEPNKGELYVKLKEERQFHTAEVQEQLRAALPKLDGVTISVEDIQFVDTGGEKPLQVGLVSDDLETLYSSAQEIKARVEKLPGLVDVTVTGEDNKADSIAEIERLNGQRVAYISANLSQGQALGDATDQVVTEAQAILPDGVQIDLEGDSARIGSIFGSFAGTLSLSVACMLSLLLLVFGRLLEPLVVGLSLPLSIVGAMLALLVTQSNFGMISLIGLIFLLGLLDKNALLLMDYANQLRQSGLSRTEAVLQTGVVRLRPIMMTTASTILGMLPIAFGLGAGSELRQPMAVAIIGGLITSTLLSLIVVPVLYTLLEDLWLKFFKGSQLNRCSTQK
ncbi:MAG: efflux RND transporter permease subunit [Symploca sp. SIO1A3]|nr:efflux RND transporter permease subunit [Symploca sp. SIO1A3]